MQNLVPTQNSYSKRRVLFQRKTLSQCTTSPQTQNRSPNTKLYSKRKTLFQTETFIRNVKPYFKRKTLFETQNLIPNAKPYSKRKSYSKRKTLCIKHCSNAKLHSEHKTFRQMQNLIPTQNLVSYVKPYSKWKTLLQRKTLQGQGYFIFQLVYYEPFIANLFIIFNIMISPCRRFMGTLFISAKSKKISLAGIFFLARGQCKTLAVPENAKPWGGGVACSMYTPYFVPNQTF